MIDYDYLLDVHHDCYVARILVVCKQIVCDFDIILFIFLFYSFLSNVPFIYVLLFLFKNYSVF